MKLSEYEMSIAAHLVDPLSMQVKFLFSTYKRFMKQDVVLKCVCVCRSPGGTLPVWMR